MSDAQPAEVLDVYYWLVGTPRPPWVSHNVERQAGEFLKRGYTLEDLEITIRFLQRQISRANAGEKNTGGYNVASMTWKKLMGDYGGSNEMDDFVAKLTLARDAQAKGWKPKLHYAATPPQQPADAKAQIAKLVSPDGRQRTSDEERARLQSQATQLLAELGNQI